MANNYQFDPSSLYTNDSFNHQNPFNQGIGDFWSNKDQWRDMQTGQQLTPEQLANLEALNKNGFDPSRVWMDNGDPHGAESQKMYDAMKTYLYKGADGKEYMIGGGFYNGGPQDQETQATNYDFAFGGVNTQAGRKPGEMSYSATEYRPDWDGDMGAYNGRGFDFFDKNGGYVGGNIPGTLGEKAWDRWQATVLASMVLAGAGAYLAPAATGASAGTTAGTATLGEGALAASGNFGVNAGTAGAAGANAAAAGAGGVGAVGATGGDGAFLGEGVQSGVGAWDGAAGGAAGGYGTVPLQGVGAPSYGSGATGSTGGMFGGGGGSSTGGMFGGSVNIPGIGSVATSDIMKYALPLLGALGGSQGQEQTTTSTKELPEWLQGPVYGNGGLIPQSQWLMNQQLTNPGMLNKGLLRTVDKKKAKERKRGLL
jgi:hypothetical protein